MVKKPKPARTHHFVPQFQLEYFALPDGTVQQYDSKENIYTRSTKSHLAAENHLYTWTDDKGNKNVLIEDMLAKLEGEISVIVKKVNNLELHFSNEERSLLSFFVAMQMYRTPQNRERTKQMVAKMTKKIMKTPAMDSQVFMSHIEEASKRIPLLKDMKKEDIEAMRKTFLEEDYDLQVPNEYFLKFMVENMRDVAAHIHEIGWVFLIAPESSQFITSDDPYVMSRAHRPGDPAWVGPGIKIMGTEITLPLTPKVCLLMSPSIKGVSHRTADQGTVREINLRTASHCRRFLYGGNEILLRSLVKRLLLDERGMSEPKVIVGGL